MSIDWFHQLLLLVFVFGSSARVRSERTKLASCHIRVSNEILLLTTTAQNTSRGTAVFTDNHSNRDRNQNLSTSLVVVVVELLAQKTKQNLTTSITRYHLDLQDCITSSSATNTPGNATVCTTTLLFPWESYYNYNLNNNTSNSSEVHTSQIQLLLVLQREESFSSSIILDATHFIEPRHNDLLLPVQLTASHILNAGDNELFLTTQSHDIITQYDHTETSFGAHHKITTTNIATVLLLVLLLFLLSVLLVLLIAYEPTNISYAQLLLQTSYHCFYPASHHDTYYYPVDCYTSTTSQHATTTDKTPVPLASQDLTSTNHGMKVDVCDSKRKQPQSGQYRNNADPNTTQVISTSSSFISSPPIAIRQTFHDATIENNIMKISTTASKKRKRETPSKIAESLTTSLRKRKKNVLVTKNDAAKNITTYTTHTTNGQSKNNNNKNQNLSSLGRKRLKLFNPSNERKKLWTLQEDDSSCKNSFDFI